jgi:hypothetical protein
VTYRTFIDGAQAGFDYAVTASTFAAAPMVIGGMGDGVGSTQLEESGRVFQAAHFGGGLLNEDVANLSARLDTLIAAMIPFGP